MLLCMLVISVCQWVHQDVHSTWRKQAPLNGPKLGRSKKVHSSEKINSPSTSFWSQGEKSSFSYYILCTFGQNHTVLTSNPHYIYHYSSNDRKSSMNRGSTLNGTRVGDTRDVQSRGFLASGINTILNYLLENNFHSTTPMSAKVLKCPSVKDFKSIVYFLF